jgi:hypothetical protein
MLSMSEGCINLVPLLSMCEVSNGAFRCGDVITAGKQMPATAESCWHEAIQPLQGATMEKKAEVKWLDRPDEKDYGAPQKRRDAGPRN